MQENNEQQSRELQELRERVIVLEQQLGFAIGVIEKHKQSFEDWSKAISAFEEKFNESFFSKSETKIIEAGSSKELEFEIKKLERKGFSVVDSHANQDGFFQNFVAIMSKRKGAEKWMKKQ